MRDDAESRAARAVADRAARVRQIVLAVGVTLAMAAAVFT